LRTTWEGWHWNGETNLDFNEASNDGVAVCSLDHMQIICTSLQTDNHTSTSSLSFYRPDALPNSQQCQSIKDNVSALKAVSERVKFNK